MITNLMSLVRAGVAAMVLAGFLTFTPAAWADGKAKAKPAAEVAAVETAPTGDSDTGVIVIVATVVGLVFAAWVFSRISDSQKPHDNVMG